MMITSNRSISCPRNLIRQDDLCSVIHLQKDRKPTYMIIMSMRNQTIIHFAQINSKLLCIAYKQIRSTSIQQVLPTIILHIYG